MFFFSLYLSHSSDVIYTKSNRCSQYVRRKKSAFDVRTNTKEKNYAIFTLSYLINWYHWCCFPLSIFSINVITFLTKIMWKIQIQWDDSFFLFLFSKMHHYYLWLYVWPILFPHMNPTMCIHKYLSRICQIDFSIILSSNIFGIYYFFADVAVAVATFYLHHN